MTKIRIFSDLHNEFNLFEVPHIKNEDSMVCVLAGDIGVATKEQTYVDFVTDVAKRHKHVIYIPGNHEYYKSSINRAFDKMKDGLKHIDNLSLFEYGSVQIDNTMFVCGTLWTDFKNADPIVMYNVGKLMNDYRVIRAGTKDDPYKRKFRPIDAMGIHKHHKKFIFDNIEQAKEKNLKVVCVTHHSPTELSVPKMFKDSNDILNSAYFSNLENDVLDHKPDVWIHGHMHEAKDYYLGDTRIICNPRGYPQEDTQFEVDKIIEV